MWKQIIFYLEVLVFLATPVVLFMIYPHFFAARYIFTVAGAIYCVARLVYHRSKFQDLGLVTLNFWSALRDLILPSFLMLISTFLIFKLLPSVFLSLILGHDPLPIDSLLERLLVYFFISTPLQELIFRGYLTWRLEQVFSSTHSIQTISIIIFTLAHIPFFSPLILLLTFIMGYVYIRNYLRYRNLYALILSHSVVGSGIIMLYFLQSYI